MVSAPRMIARALAGVLALVSLAEATVTQVDGSILPQNPAAMQGYLDAEGEGGPPAATALEAVIDAASFPEIYLPNTAAPVAFRLIGEGGGFENSFGWYNVGDDITTGAGRARNLHPVMGCGTSMVDGVGGEDPAALSDAQLLSPPHNQHHHGAPASYVTSAEPGASTTVDFAAEQAAGRYRGGFIAFYVISPEGHASPFNCGDFKVDLISLNLFGRIYHSQADLNNDGDFVHNLVYRSKRATDRFYFGFEDLFRGGDNDFEDVLTQVTGLTPQCTPTLEVCDGADNDCDLLVDGADPDAFGIGDPCVCDDVALPCMGGARQGQCLPGTTVCVGGELQCAPRRGPSAEICDGIDNNCNGVIDDVPGPCEVEICNGLDDDGDGLTDELPLPDLGTPCGIDEGECELGVTCCATGGVLDCCADERPEPEVCDCLDNDCDGVTDEDDSRACYDGPATECDPVTGLCRGICRLGTQLCTTVGCPGAPGTSCTGEVGPRPEECNCLDDDCDGLTDDGAMCLSGAPCVACTCATPCDPEEEFPCVAGQICDCACGSDPPCHCAPDPCQTTTCGPTEICDSCSGTCLDPCAGCAAGTTCCDGQCCQPFETCAAGQCLTCADPRVGCPKGEVCAGGRCVADPCRDIACDAGQFCLDGQCRPLCPRCPDGERCQDGACVFDACADIACIGASQVCCEGICGHDPCVGMSCSPGEICDSCAGVCADDPCLRVRCPDGYACLRGECAPGASRRTRELAAGGDGGCACAVGGTPARPLGGLTVWLAAACLLAARFRRRAAGALALGLALWAGCDVNTFVVTDDLGVYEFDGSVPVPEGCDPVPEACNAVDDDCNGLVDDGDPGGGQLCGIEEGECRLGATACSSGQVVCRDDIRPEPEACDRLDNDCDAETDEVFDFCNSTAHCGECSGPGGAGQTGPCAIAHAVAACDPSGCAGACVGCARCRIDLCELGWVDCQGNDPPDDCDCPCSLSPGPEVCDDIDNDCDGSVDEDVFATCYTGPAGTWNVGECDDGSQACVGGVFSGPCLGEVTPLAEACNSLDDDCDGATDVDDAGATLSEVCYDGAPGTLGVGPCVGGTRTCAFGAWGPCDGQVIPGPERCADSVDGDCDTFDDAQEGCAAPAGVEVRIDEPGGAEGSAAGTFHSYDLAMAGAGSPTGRTVYLVWTDLRNGAADVFFRRSSDGGATFADIQNLTVGTATPCVAPSLAAVHDPLLGADRVYVAYQTVIGGLRRIVVQQSSDDGATFVFPTSPAGGLLDAGGSNDSFHHDVAAGLSRAIVVWEEMDAAATVRRIKSRASIDGGATFSSEREVTVASGPTPGAGRPVATVTASGRFVVVWRERRAGATFDVFANRSDDDTTPFAAGDERRLDADGADGRISDRPFVLSAGDNVYVVWEDSGTAAGAGADVMFARSLDGANTFSGETILDDALAEVSASARPALAVDTRTADGADDGVYVVWEDFRQGSQVFATRSLDSGATFSLANRVSSQASGPAAGATRWPSLVSFGAGGLAAAYENDGAGAPHVYVSLSIDDGLSWSADHQTLDSGAGPAERPVLAAADDGAATGLVAGWTDRRVAPGVYADPFATRVLR